MTSDDRQRKTTPKRRARPDGRETSRAGPSAIGFSDPREAEEKDANERDRARGHEA